MLRHPSAAMTLDVYAGLFADDLDGLRQARPRLHEIECGPDADRKACKPVQPGVLPFENSPAQAAG